jgi:hypothetical protein
MYNKKSRAAGMKMYTAFLYSFLSSCFVRGKKIVGLGTLDVGN